MEMDRAQQFFDNAKSVFGLSMVLGLVSLGCFFNDKAACQKSDKPAACSYTATKLSSTATGMSLLHAGGGIVMGFAQRRGRRQREQLDALTPNRR